MTSDGSLRRSLSDSRSFDFGSDDILCAYDDYTPQQDQTADARRLDPSAKDLHENTDKRPLVDFYGQPEEFPREYVMSAVEKCMKKYADNLMRYLEGISGRLTQLELYCFKLEKSLSEFRTDMIHGESEADTKLNSLEKHVHEVHRSLQIIRDKQEIIDTQKELTKLQLSQNVSTELSQPQKNDEDVKAATSEAQDVSSMPNQQLALALPHQRPSPPSHPIRATDHNQLYRELPVQQPAPASLNVTPQDCYIPNQASTYYTEHRSLPLEQMSQHLSPELHYAPRRPQMQNLSIQAQSLPQAQVVANQLNQQQPFSQYQQHWPPLQQQQPSPQVQVPMPQTLPTHPPYDPYQPINSVHERFQASSMPAPAPYSAPQSRGYGVSGSSVSRPPPQQSIQWQPPSPNSQGSFHPSPLAKSSHVRMNPYPPHPNIQGYNSAFAVDGSRAAHTLNFQTGKYQPTINMPASPNRGDYLFGEMVKEAVGMGYPRDEVISILQRMGETTQLLDFNALLDELNAHASGGPPQAWSR